MTALLAIEGLEAGYGESAVLHGIDLAVAPASITALMGRNGMGKTTLLRTLMGLLPARRGRVRFAGQEIARWPTQRIARAGLAYVPQGREVFEAFTVAENLRLAAIGHGRKALDARLFTWFPRLEARLGQRAGTLSGGEQQMLAIARALGTGPRLLLLDEPTEGLQPSIVHEIALTLKAIAAETGLTVLLVEQNVDMVLTLAERIAFIEGGRIVEEAPAAAVAADETILARHLSL